MRWQRHGDPTAGNRGPALRAADGRACAVPDCESERYRTSAYCNLHRNRIRKYGTFGEPPSRLLPDGTEYLDSYGYVRVMARNSPMANSKGYVPKHRLVMSEHLGRPLTTDESVHHRSGDKADNRIENLELWVGYGKQPSGQRPSDMVRWARGILDQYAAEVESGLL